MFEKEAEEYSNKNCGTISLPIHEAYARGLEEGFQDGAEFGYNKANEWHYVKEGDLPNTELGRVDVTVAYINAYDNPCKKDCCFDGTKFVYWDDKEPIGWRRVDIFGRIYAWKYPEKLPELKESE